MVEQKPCALARAHISGQGWINKELHVLMCALVFGHEAVFKTACNPKDVQTLC
jgi:hypothetical protein